MFLSFIKINSYILTRITNHSLPLYFSRIALSFFKNLISFLKPFVIHRRCFALEKLLFFMMVSNS